MIVRSQKPIGHVVARAPALKMVATWKVPVWRELYYDLGKYAFQNKTIYNPEGDFMSHRALSCAQVAQLRIDQELDRPSRRVSS